MPHLMIRFPLHAFFLTVLTTFAILTAPPASGQSSATLSPAAASTITGPPIAARAYMVTDLMSDQVIVMQSADDRFEPASLTKLMTAYLVFNALRDKKITLKQVVPVSVKAWRAEGSRMFIEPNRPVTVDELLQGMIVQSGNDASIALAELIGASEETFAGLMNAEAKKMGLTNTQFTNATGLPHRDHYSSARDLSILATRVIRDHPEFYRLYAQKEYRYNSITQPNRNRLLWIDPHVDGMKTGHTDAAGFCLVSSARRGERRLLAVVLGTTSDALRTSESQKLLNFGFTAFDTKKLYSKGQVVAEPEVFKGLAKRVKLGFAKDVTLTLPNDRFTGLSAVAEYKQPMLAPLKSGQAIGLMRLTKDGQMLAEIPLVTLEEVPQASLLARGWDALRLKFR
jgi:serine-type D-Ala-D-Ala carboxypeptidase (penicillin-binding protein 5/6)